MTVSTPSMPIDATTPHERASGELVLVTAAYPHGSGEQFLEAEIAHLCAEFDTVRIVPLQADGVQTRALPPNAVVDTRYAALRSRNIGGIAHALLGALSAGLLPRALLEAVTSAPKSIAQLRLRLTDAVRAAYRTVLFERSMRIAARAPDCIYFYWLLPEALGAHRWRVRSGSRSRIVARAHGYEIYAEQQYPGGFYALRPALVDAVDGIWAVSEDGAAKLRSAHPAQVARIGVARLGVPASTPGPAPSGDALRVLTISALIPIKRVDRLCEALLHHVRAAPGRTVHWTHVGDGPLRDSIQARVASARPSLVLDMTGQIPNSDVRALLRSTAFDVIVNCSESEGTPVSLMEAMSAGIPVLAPSIGGIPELLAGGAGVLMSPDPDVAEIQSGLLRFDRSNAHREMRDLALRTWAERYDANRNFREFAREVLRDMPRSAAKL